MDHMQYKFLSKIQGASSPLKNGFRTLVGAGLITLGELCCRRAVLNLPKLIKVLF